MTWTKKNMKEEGTRPWEHGVGDYVKGCQNRRGHRLILLRAITIIIGREYDISEFQNRIKIITDVIRIK